MTLAHWLSRADALCRAGKYFEAHEELEAGWLKASGDEKVLLQGLIQVAAGLHRLRAAPSKPEGAYYLFERGLLKLRACRALLGPGGLARLGTQLAKMKAAGQAPLSFRLGLSIS
ncbi:MAG: DUF309 domain-containing protein [Elusimicrobiota bacterium]|nr:DUF309 domain-containing protein [Elusimicrobiota bacterium]